LHLPHEEDPHADQQEHREPGNEDGRQQRLFFLGLAEHLHAVLHQVGDHPCVARRSEGVTRALRRGDLQRAALDLDPPDLAGARLVQELGVTHGLNRFLPALELLENREQDERDHHPYGGFREHVVVQREAPCGALMTGRWVNPERSPVAGRALQTGIQAF
jgi:hypothetical protein